MEKHVQDLITKAALTDKADEALKFSQAACNSANAMCALATAKSVKPSADVDTGVGEDEFA